MFLIPCFFKKIWNSLATSCTPLLLAICSGASVLTTSSLNPSVVHEAVVEVIKDTSGHFDSTVHFDLFLSLPLSLYGTASLFTLTATPDCSARVSLTAVSMAIVISNALFNAKSVSVKSLFKGFLSEFHRLAILSKHPLAYDPICHVQTF